VGEPERAPHVRPHSLSEAVLQDRARALVAALAFVLTPAGLFMTSMYRDPRPPRMAVS
jgi:hypothetical protein